VAAPVDSARSAERKAREAIALCHALLSERGEVSGAALARDALAAYDALPANAFQPYISLLAKDFSPAPISIAAAAAAYAIDPSPQNLVALLRELKANPDWVGVDADLEHLFGSWFNRGFLRLERIDWRTPALILEKLIEYEAVHEIAGWKDLHRRLASDRRCFAFFHPALPEEPLIFIEVALTERISTTVAPLLDPDSPEVDPARADCAMFYSITNCQDGLRGISFGNLLIKQVVHELGREFPRLKTFATLSPVPGFRAWLAGIARDHAVSVPDLARLDERDWFENPAVAERLRPPLMGLCAHYLTAVKKDDEPLDAVARFHLGNGARMEKLNWLADTSKPGMQRSAGIMVNYLYRLADVEKNHEAFVREHEVAASHELKKLARECALTAPAART
jgi:malonyl-CoA decarboxylase